MIARSQTRLPYGLVIFLGCAIAAIGFGPRSVMGFFLTPITMENNWSREVFSLAIAFQNLMWGLAQPFAGMIADRYGTARVLVAGSITYSLALFWMSSASDPSTFMLSAGILMGIGIAGSGFFLVLAAFSRLLPPHIRTVGFGLGTAAGSLGQFLFAPISQGLMASYGWRETLVIISVIVLIVPLIAPVFRGRLASSANPGESEQSLGEALREAFGHKSYILLVFGFFVCGWHLAFITTHLPPYLADEGIDAKWGGWAIALIGLFNVIGAFASGLLSGRFAMRYVLSLIYLARSIAIALFILMPTSELTVLLFSASMGLLWLSTVPPTQGLVIKMFGVRYIATLFGFVFLSHQIGSFLGVWLGGVLYDSYGSYDIIWWLSVALGIFAALVHWPIREQAVPRLAATQAASAS